jgi:hypothetical protein
VPGLPSQFVGHAAIDVQPDNEALRMLADAPPKLGGLFKGQRHHQLARVVPAHLRASDTIS